MNSTDALAILSAMLRDPPLSNIQEQVFHLTWQGLTYTEISANIGYEESYIRDVGAKLWQRLSQIIGEKVTKNNINTVVEHYIINRNQAISAPLPLSHSSSTMLNQTRTPDRLEFPGSPLPLNSEFYINRPPVEELAYAEIGIPGSIIRIKAPSKMGKSSLLQRIIAHAKAQGFRTVNLDFQQAEESVFVNLDKFLRWFCANVARQLQLPPNLDDYWEEDIGSKVSCTFYLQGYVLAEIDTPILLTLNEVNRLLEYDKIAKDFMPLMRSWHEEAQLDQGFQQLRFVVVHSTEIYTSLNINQSPFNVGLPLVLPELTLEQVQELAHRYQLDGMDESQVADLMAMVGGHPYLIQLALYNLRYANLSLPQLLEEAPTLAGVYSHHLRRQFATVEKNPELVAALQQVVMATESVRLDAIAAYKLESMGLITLRGNQATIRCELYRRYLREQLSLESPPDPRVGQLEQENQQLKYLSRIDDLTRLANRRNFDDHLAQEWQRLAEEEVPLALILADIDFFKLFNDAFGHLTGDFCLEQIAQAIRECVKHPEALVARFGGEEFAIIVPRMEREQAVQLAEQIRERVKALNISHDPYRMCGYSSIITLSLGVASMIPHPESDPLNLVQMADEALFESKRQGRDRVTFR
ncbi:MAG: AAA-like domain-containing protein [Coleofasciculus sp. C1-SOL-03]|jgi:diguanylate cyclase (GGDEF)-like protein|uniref:AAA-like domain-containing protein n=1 Tax=Coleofasciculus sp. C1-SOL-03 TaxID=3069522 RepID=UPI0032FBF401